MVFICWILQPFKYGAPLGFIYTLIIFLQVSLNLDDLALFRWVLVGIILVASNFLNSDYRVKKPVSLKVLWFSGFSLNIAANLVFGIVCFLTTDLIFRSELALKETIYIVFFEVLSQVTVSLIVLSILTPLILKLNRNGQRREN